MVTFPNAKINIGLNVLNKRPDGYHNIESLFYPIPLKDALEVLKTDGDFSFSSSGIALECDDESNLVVKAFRLLQQTYSLPNVKIHLHKNIPFGAGLGGGSADAAFVMLMINQMFELKLSEEKLIAYAAQIGADCAFFIKNTPCIAEGIGEKLTPFSVDLKDKYLLLVKPDVEVPTANAYKYVQPFEPDDKLVDVLVKPVQEWGDGVKNDFEPSVFKQYPELSAVKEELKQMGASYVAMSGSGASLYGIFDQKPADNPAFENHFQFLTKL